MLISFLLLLTAVAVNGMSFSLDRNYIIILLVFYKYPRLSIVGFPNVKMLNVKIIVVSCLKMVTSHTCQ